jgi:hypothetical protein
MSRMGRSIIVSYPGLCTRWPSIGLFVFLAKTPYSQDYGPMSSSSLYTQAGGTKDNIYLLCLKCPTYLKLQFQYSGLWY